MGDKIKTQKGFIQIPLLIAIIVSVIAVSIATTGVVLYKQGRLTSFVDNISLLFEKTEDVEEISQQEQELERARLEAEKDEDERLKAEQEAQRIAELEQKIEKLEKNQKLEELQEEYDNLFPEKKENSEIITADDLDTILRYVGSIVCSGGNKVTNGSASVWVVNWDWGNNLALTNAHMFPSSTSLWCLVTFDYLGTYNVNVDQIPSISLNDFVDFAFLEIESVASGGESTSVPVASLSSELVYIPHCPKAMSLGLPVAVIGYPIGAMSQGGVSNKAVTTGIISSYDSTPSWSWNGYPDVNYFVSAKIDEGNSGGLAISKYNGELCILGIPTWVKEGRFENMGIVQSIHNIWNPR